LLIKVPADDFDDLLVGLKLCFASVRRVARALCAVDDAARHKDKKLAKAQAAVGHVPVRSSFLGGLSPPPSPAVGKLSAQHHKGAAALPFHPEKSPGAAGSALLAIDVDGVPPPPPGEDDGGGGGGDEADRAAEGRQEGNSVGWEGVGEPVGDLEEDDASGGKGRRRGSWFGSGKGRDSTAAAAPGLPTASKDGGDGAGGGGGGGASKKGRRPSASVRISRPAWGGGIGEAQLVDAAFASVALGRTAKSPGLKKCTFKDRKAYTNVPLFLCC